MWSPDVEFQERFEFRLGDQTFLLVFGHGHTEDSIWVYHPERKVLVCGDLFQWTAPNVGNPFKMQRFALENAIALEEMAGLDSEVLCPGHGPVIYGRETIKTCLLTAARYLHHIQEHVVACLNKGMILEETIAGLTMPDDLMNSKWLPPMYGHPVFISKGIYKRYAGYYSGHPAELFPPQYTNLSKEVLNLAGGSSPLIQKEIIGIQSLLRYSLVPIMLIPIVGTITSVILLLFPIVWYILFTPLLGEELFKPRM